MTSTKPDVEAWDHTDETLRLLAASIAQIRSTMLDGDDSVDTLTTSFVGIADTLVQLMEHKTDIEHTDLAGIHQQIVQGVVAFQFYDRISQRLDHVTQSLEKLSAIIQAPEKRTLPEEWRHLQDWIEKQFTLESEKRLYQAILAGQSIEDAVRQYRKADAKPADDDIELF